MTVPAADFSTGTQTFGTNMNGVMLYGVVGNNSGYGSGYWINNGTTQAGIASTRPTSGNWGADLRFFTHPATTSNISTASEVGRFDPNGNFLVGATSNPNSGKINIDFNGGAVNGIVYNDTASANGTVFAYFTVSGTACGQINRISTTNAVTYASASDRRLKSNIQPITAEQSGSIIDALKPCSFTWNSNNSEDVGFIADEFQTVIPRAVSGQPNGTKEQEYEVTPAVQDEDGNVITPAVMGTKTIPDYQMLEASTAEMIAYLVTEVQSLRKRVAQLEGV
jgi:hypothetical protein